MNSVFQLYKDCRWAPISEVKTAAVTEAGVVSHICSVLDAYGKFHAFQLERLTHSKKPWMEARHGLQPDVPSRQPISRETMKEFYSQQLG